jgi:hypothetical protein
MNLSLRGIVKGVTTGLETLVETGNPVIAAGAGAACLLTSPASPSSPIPTFSPMLDALSAENPTEQQHVNTLSSFAGQQREFASIVDPEA